MMLKKYRNLHPKWTQKSQQDIYGIVITTDLDSLMAAAIHKVIYPQDVIIGYYDFHKECMLVGDHDVVGVIYVDANMSNERCWGNHPTYMVGEDGHMVINELSANLNNWFGPRFPSDFTNKVHFSTTLHMLSFYGFDLRKLTEEALAVILKLDGVSDTFLEGNTRWMEKDAHLLSEILGYPYLLDFFKDWDRRFFDSLDIKYGIHRKIYYDSSMNGLVTHIQLDGLNELFEPLGIRLKLPDGRFEVVKRFEYGVTSPYSPEVPIKSDIYSNCWNKKRTILYSRLKSMHMHH